VAGQLKAPVLGLYGGEDPSIPLDQVEKVKAAFKGKKAEFFIYPAGHGFSCWDRGSYDAPSAALAHGRSLEFLARNLY